MAVQHTIIDEKMGHRPPLSPYEPTVFYGLKMPLSLKAWCIRVGPEYVRRVLRKAVQTRLAKDTSKRITEDINLLNNHQDSFTLIDPGLF